MALNKNKLTWAITFQYNKAENAIFQQQISQKQVSKHNGVIIVGRDANVCDLVLSNHSISSLQAEIHFDKNQQQFFIKNKNAVSTTIVDGKILAFDKELPLNNGSIIVFGQQEIEITEIKIYPLPSTNYPRIKTSVLPFSNKFNTGNINSSLNSESIYPDNISEKKKSWSDKQIIMAIATVVASIITAISGWYINERTQNTQKEIAQITAKSNDKSEQTNSKEKVLDLSKKNANYHQLKFVNKCSKDVQLATTFYALNNVAQTQGWVNITPQKNVDINYFTKSSGIFLYAYMINKNGKEIVWKDHNSVEKSITKERNFDYIEESFPDINIPKEIVKFYEIKFDLQADGYTTKTFTCDDQDKLELK
ncbi:FHA domain-containing protein [Anabaena sp. FACHB-1237]|uniref:FHA domain-containing protein n=1 Tax=Anabaena sp. FACHB-1237 TaxID=2692769 RepID=UPI001680334A|nr:FHA domain-containing protein [Anabaena sp. FACHB-1237]MBD2138217.1 FHA domain-containing protein [Anabaena sp. FACHB-1237]